MDEEFDLNKMPTSIIYSESEETKQLRHLFYKKKNKIFALKVLFNIFTIIGVLLLFIGFIKILITSINNELNNHTNLTSLNFLVIIGAIVLLAGITIGICIKQYSTNTLDPIKQDITRSIMNDQLELTGSRSNRHTNAIIEKNNEHKDNQNIKNNYNKLVQDYNDLLNKHEELLKLFENLQNENITTNKHNEVLNKKYEKLKTEYNKIINSLPTEPVVTKNIKKNTDNATINIKKEKNKKSTSIVILTLALLLNTALFVLGIVSLILQFNANTSNLTLIICLIIANSTLLYSEFVICIYLHACINKYFNSKRS